MLKRQMILTQIVNLLGEYRKAGADFYVMPIYGAEKKGVALFVTKAHVEDGMLVVNDDDENANEIQPE